jgi:RNA polymerase sigma-70 factor (ECF subfamily)
VPGGDRGGASQAASFEDTDWPRIAGLYSELGRHDPPPVVAINRAVAVALLDGWEAGVTPLDGLDTDRHLLARYQSLHSVRAELLRRAVDAARADAAYANDLALRQRTHARAAPESCMTWDGPFG